MRICTTLLSYDHGILRTVLDVFEKVCSDNTLETYAEETPEVILFLSDFMDHYHHGVEERFMFPYASKRSKDLFAQVPILISQHRTAKGFVDQIGSAYERKDPAAISEAGIALVEHMKKHIALEEDKIFPKIEELLLPEDDLEMNEKTQAWIAENFGASFQHDWEEYSYRYQNKILGQTPPAWS